VEAERVEVMVAAGRAAATEVVVRDAVRQWRGGERGGEGGGGEGEVGGEGGGGEGARWRW